MPAPRLLLAGVLAVLLAAVGISASWYGRAATESPQDLARRAIDADSPREQAAAATRLAALASAHRPSASPASRVSSASTPASTPASQPNERAVVVAGLRETLRSAKSGEARAAAVVGLARSGDRSVLPLVVAAIEDPDPLVAGRAVAAAQHMLGVRYGADERPLDREDCRRIADMARADMAALNGPGKDWWDSHTIQGATW